MPIAVEILGDLFHIEDRVEGRNPGSQPLLQSFPVRQESLQAAEGNTHESDVLRSSGMTDGADLLCRVDRAPSLAKRIEVDGTGRLVSYRGKSNQTPARRGFGEPLIDPSAGRHPHPRKRDDYPVRRLGPEEIAEQRSGRSRDADHLRDASVLGVEVGHFPATSLLQRNGATCRLWRTDDQGDLRTDRGEGAEGPICA